MSNSKEHYVFIPESTMLHEKFKGVRPHARLLYAYLVLKRAGVDDWFTYPYKDIRRDTGYKFDTIAKGIKQLSERGLIRYTHGGLERNYNRYYLDPIWLNRQRIIEHQRLDC